MARPPSGVGYRTREYRCGAGVEKHLGAFFDCRTGCRDVVDEQEAWPVEPYTAANRERPADVLDPLLVAKPDLMPPRPQSTKYRCRWKPGQPRDTARQRLGGIAPSHDPMPPMRRHRHDGVDLVEPTRREDGVGQPFRQNRFEFLASAKLVRPNELAQPSFICADAHRGMHSYSGRSTPRAPTIDEFVRSNRTGAARARRRETDTVRNNTTLATNVLVGADHSSATYRAPRGEKQIAPRPGQTMRNPQRGAIGRAMVGHTRRRTSMRNCGSAQLPSMLDHSCSRSTLGHTCINR